MHTYTAIIVMQITPDDWIDVRDDGKDIQELVKQMIERNADFPLDDLSIVISQNKEN